MRRLFHRPALRSPRARCSSPCSWAAARPTQRSATTSSPPASSPRTGRCTWSAAAAAQRLPARRPADQLERPGTGGARPGRDGEDGADGISVTSVALVPGADPNCPLGGSKFTSASGVTYACNGGFAAESRSPNGAFRIRLNDTGIELEGRRADPRHNAGIGSTLSRRWRSAGTDRRPGRARQMTLDAALSRSGRPSARRQGAASSAASTSLTPYRPQRRHGADQPHRLAHGPNGC